MHQQLGRGWPVEAVGWVHLCQISLLWSGGALPLFFFPSPSVLSPLISCDLRCGQEQAVWSGATCWLAKVLGSLGVLLKLLGIPNARQSCWRWPWAVAFERQEGRRAWVRAHSVITSHVSVGNHGVFLIGLNGRAFIESLSVKFSCLVFVCFFFPPSYSKQTAELFPQTYPFCWVHWTLCNTDLSVKKCNLNFISNFSAVLCWILCGKKVKSSWYHLPRACSRVVWGEVEALIFVPLTALVKEILLDLHT